ncbi:MAG: hypothetical protein AB8U25_05905 [Rickettsiales endosymbiont of Dermacentor nuttalli]
MNLDGPILYQMILEKEQKAIIYSYIDISSEKNFPSELSHKLKEAEVRLEHLKTIDETTPTILI